MVMCNSPWGFWKTCVASMDGAKKVTEEQSALRYRRRSGFSRRRYTETV